MGRKKIEIQLQENSKERRVTFKKRRFGLLKKAMQLSIMSNTVVALSVYNTEDKSFLEYISNETNISDKTNENKKDLHEYVKVSNKNYNLIEKLDFRL